MQKCSSISAIVCAPQKNSARSVAKQKNKKKGGLCLHKMNIFQMLAFILCSTKAVPNSGLSETELLAGYFRDFFLWCKLSITFPIPG
jgi:hypothetical protein